MGRPKEVKDPQTVTMTLVPSLENLHSFLTKHDRGLSAAIAHFLSRSRVFSYSEVLINGE